MLNSAFSVSGAYLIGGQMGFVANLSSGYEVAVFIIAKLICGMLCTLIACRIYDESKKEQ